MYIIVYTITYNLFQSSIPTYDIYLPKPNDNAYMDERRPEYFLGAVSGKEAQSD